MKGFVDFLGIYKIKTFWGMLALTFLLALGVLSMVVFSDYYPQVFASQTFAEKIKDVNPNEPIGINFSFSPLRNDYQDNIKIYPKEDLVFDWSSDGKKLLIAPKNFWKPESEYEITLPESRNSMLVNDPQKKIRFRTISYPKVTSFYPEDNSKDLLVDMEDPMVVNFDKSTRGFFVNFVLSPGKELVFENNSDKNQFKLLPKSALESGKKYSVDVYIKLLEEPNDNYRKIYSGTFETKPSLIQSWEKDLNLRLAQAKEFTQAKIIAGKYIDINLKAQIMSTFQDGKLLGSYLISSGKKGMETPKGEHQIYSKTPRAWSKEYGLFMPFWMAIVSSGKVGIHELPEWPGGFKEGANHLGIPVSHGCVRLGIGPAKQIYEWADIGTKVIVY